MELLIALTLSMMLLGLLSAVYVIMAGQHKLQSNLTYLQANFNWLSEILRQDLHWAGYVGCSKLTKVFSIANPSAYLLTSKNKWEIDKNSEGVETITIRHRSIANGILLESMRKYDELNLSADFQVSKGDILLISDCKSGDIFKVAAVFKFENQIQRVVAAVPLKRKYQAGAEFGRLEVNRYWADKNGLSVTDIHGRKSVLVSGPMKMNFRLYVRQENDFVEVGSEAVRGFSSVAGILLILELTQGHLNKKQYVFVNV